MAKISLGKLFDGFFTQKKITLNARTLRYAGIGVLTEDERWNRLFSSVEKSSSIIKAEAAISKLLDERTRLHMENNMIQAEKHVKLNSIIELTDKAINEDNESARAEIEKSETRVREINEREPQIEQRLDEIDEDVKEINLAMLEDAVSYLYQYMKKTQTRVAELDTQIADTREALKNKISERGTLDASANETYQFLHGLLGAAQIESLDDHYTLDGKSRS